jgi:hypothetical protein
MLVSSPAAAGSGVDSRVVVGAAVCWQGQLLWGSVPLQDLQSLTLLAGRVLGPAAAAGMAGKVQSKVSTCADDFLAWFVNLRGVVVARGREYG